MIYENLAIQVLSCMYLPKSLSSRVLRLKFIKIMFFFGTVQQSMSYENLKNELGQSTKTLFQWSISKQNFLPELVFNQHVLAPLDSVTLDTLQGRPLICPTALRKAFPRPVQCLRGDWDFSPAHPLQCIATCLHYVSCSPRTHKPVFLGISHHFIFTFVFTAGIKQKFVDLWSRFLIMCQTLLQVVFMYFH